MKRTTINDENKTGTLRPPDRRPTVLIIAGSDPSGGAGIQGDIKTCCAHGVYSMAAITALTVQNTFGVKKFRGVDPGLIGEQVESVVTDIRPDAVKIGMMPSAGAVTTVSDILLQHGLTNIVVDPVLISTSGHKLSDDTRHTAEAMINRLFPLATVITPNLLEEKYLRMILEEQGLLNGSPVSSFSSSNIPPMYGAQALLLKGGHADGNICRDILYFHEKEHVVTREYVSERIITHNSHGTGCALSTAIACRLAQGYNITDATEKGKRFLFTALLGNADRCIGKGYVAGGHGPLDFFSEFQ